jgi:hypothetical protein
MDTMDSSVEQLKFARVLCSGLETGDQLRVSKGAIYLWEPLS